MSKTLQIVREALIALLETQFPDYGSAEAREFSCIGLTDAFLEGHLVMRFNPKEQCIVFFECSGCQKWDKSSKEMNVKPIKKRLKAE